MVVSTFYDDITGTTSGSGTGAKLKFRKSALGLQVAATTAGSKYAEGDTITVKGSDVDESGNITVGVLSVTDAGGIVMLEIK